MITSRELASALRAVLPADRVLVTPEDLIVHGYDGTWLEHAPTPSSHP